MGGIPFGEDFCHWREGEYAGSFSDECAYLNRNTFDWFNRQPVWLQVALGGSAAYGTWWLLKKRRS